MQQLYIERMEQAYRHKRYFSKIIQSIGRPHTPEQRFNRAFTDTKDYLRILDYGCGSGVVAWNIARDIPTAQVVGYDLSLDMIEVARERFVEKNLTFTARKDDLGDEPKFDFIVLSSVLHEVFSKTGYLHDIHLLLKEIAGFLRPGGFIISRDPYIGEHSPSDVVSFPFKNSAVCAIAKNFFEDLLKLVPDHLRDYYTGRTNISVDVTGRERLTGSRRITFELLNKLTWGYESLPRESQEYLYCLTQKTFQTLLPKELRIVATDTYQDINFLQYLNKWVDIDLDGDYPTHLWTLIEKVDT